MIAIKIFKDENQRIDRFVISGHSGYAPSGSDIVCAAVSAISQTAVLGVIKVTGITEGIIRKDGYMEYNVPKNTDKEIDEKVNVILDTMVLGLINLSKEYSKYIEIKELEV